MQVSIRLTEENFAASGRTPKGRKTRRAIFQAVRNLIVGHGVESMSLEAVAEAAGLTQAALRHYFPTREELLTEFFVAATTWFQSQVESLVQTSDVPGAVQLERCIAWHLEYMEQVDTAFWLEASAYWIRHSPGRQTRDEFYRWLLREYARLIGSVRPELGALECQRKAYLILSLVLGSWITHGRGSAVGDGVAGTVEQRHLLVDGAMELVGP